MTFKPRIALIIGSTRPTRFADKPAQWDAQASPDPGRHGRGSGGSSRSPPAVLRREGIELVDAQPGSGSDPLAADHRLVSTAIFSSSPNTIGRSPALSRTLSIRLTSSGIGKPFTAIGYGGLGAARAIEHLRLIGVELQMVPDPRRGAYRRRRLHGRRSDGGKQADRGDRGQSPAIREGGPRRSGLVGQGDKGQRRLRQPDRDRTPNAFVPQGKIACTRKRTWCCSEAANEAASPSKRIGERYRQVAVSPG